MNNRIKKTLVLVLFAAGLLANRSYAADVDGKLILLEIRLDGKSMASAVWPEKVGAKPESLWPYMSRRFMATKELMPKPDKGTSVTLKGRVVIRLRWPSGKVLDAVKLDQLTLAYAKPSDVFPKETRWLIKKEEIKRIRNVFDKEQAEKRKSAEKTQ